MHSRAFGSTSASMHFGVLMQARGAFAQRVAHAAVVIKQL